MSGPVKTLARDWALEVMVGSAWTVVKGLSSLTFTGTKSDADTTSFDEDGWESHLVARRGRGVGVESFYLENPTDGTQDAGQKAVEDIGELVGHNAFGTFRLTSPAFVARTFQASVDVTETGGGESDPTGFKFNLNVNGKVDKARLDPATLTSLTEDLAGSLVPAFDADTYEYTLDALNAEDSVEFTATKVGATITGDGVHQLAIGPNLIRIYVSEAGKATAIYKIQVNRAS